MSEKPTLAVQHLNSCVYELAVNEEGETKHLFKQHNNVIPVIGVVIERRVDATFHELQQQILEKFKDVVEPVKCMPAYPITDADLDTKANFTLIYGWMVEYRKHDPNQPIAVPVDDPEGHDRAMRAALMPYPVSVPFMLAFMETPKYMFDITLSHVPADAVVKTTDLASVEVDEDISQIAVGVKPEDTIFTPEETGYLRDISHRAREYFYEHPNATTAELDAKFARIAEEITGYDDDNLAVFLSKLQRTAASKE